MHFGERATGVEMECPIVNSKTGHQRTNNRGRVNRVKPAKSMHLESFQKVWVMCSYFISLPLVSFLSRGGHSLSQTPLVIRV